jgi:hypothetical protein
MGRPIKKRFFAGTAVVADTAGMGVATPNGVTILTSGTNYSSSTVVTFSQPDMFGGIAAIGHVTVNGVGNIASFVVDTAGSGYTQDPGIALTNVGTGSGATFSITLTGVSGTGKITCSAYLPAHSATARTSVILKQESSRRYLVQNSDGDGQCRLTASGSLTAGQMSITATDSAGGTYYVTKLTSRKALLTPITGSQFATGTYAKWLRSSDGSPVANVSVTIPVA